MLQVLRKVEAHTAAMEKEERRVAAKSKAARVVAAKKKMTPRVLSPEYGAKGNAHRLDCEDVEEAVTTLEYSNALEKLLHNPGAEPLRSRFMTLEWCLCDCAGIRVRLLECVCVCVCV
jgi:hypothetical protein